MIAGPNQPSHHWTLVTLDLNCPASALCCASSFGRPDNRPSSWRAEYKSWNYAPMASDPQIIRQWLLLTLLASRRQGPAVRKLAEVLHGGEKSIRRDIETWRGVGFAMEETVGERGRKTWRKTLVAPGECDGLESRASVRSKTEFFLASRRAMRRLSSLFVWALFLAPPPASAETPEPAERPSGRVKQLFRPELFETLVNPNCSHCVDEAKRRAAELRDDDRVLAWTRGKYEGGAVPWRFFLVPYRVISDTYGVFVYDADAGFVRGYEPSLDFRFHGWRNGVMVIRHKDGTLFSALSGRAFDGPRKGEQLKPIATIETDWGYWSQAYPGSVAYHMFDKYQPQELPNRENAESAGTRLQGDPRKVDGRTRVIGLALGDRAKAWPLAARSAMSLVRVGRRIPGDRIAARPARRSAAGQGQVGQGSFEQRQTARAGRGVAELGDRSLDARSPGIERGDRRARRHYCRANCSLAPRRFPGRSPGSRRPARSDGLPPRRAGAGRRGARPLLLDRGGPQCPTRRGSPRVDGVSRHAHGLARAFSQVAAAQAGRGGQGVSLDADRLSSGVRRASGANRRVARTRGGRLSRAVAQ
jgi:hypothetical protein